MKKHKKSADLLAGNVSDLISAFGRENLPTVNKMLICFPVWNVIKTPQVTNCESPTDEEYGIHVLLGQ